MTAELRISVPDDVADWLRRQDDESAAVSEAVRAWIRAERINELLRSAELTASHVGLPSFRPAEPPSRLAEGRRTLADRPGLRRT